MKNFKITKYQIPINRRKYHMAGDIRIVLLSDLHNEEYGRGNERLLAAIDRQKPDLIAAAGDMLTSGIEREEQIALALMQRLAVRYPVYYGPGNHEYRLKLDKERYGIRYERYVRKLAQAGVRLLENEFACLTLRGLPMRIWGLQLPWRFYKRFSYRQPSKMEMRSFLGSRAEDKYEILLAHNPMCFSAYAKWGADLTLSGHLHGGFFRIPLVGGVVSPQCVPFPKYDRGVFEKDGKHMVVSAGLGSHSQLPRLGNPTELVVIDLVRSDDSEIEKKMR